jgi:hypothetical protein
MVKQLQKAKEEITMTRELFRTNATKMWLAALCMATFGLILAAGVAADS